MPSAYIIP